MHQDVGREKDEYSDCGGICLQTNVRHECCQADQAHVWLLSCAPYKESSGHITGGQAAASLRPLRLAQHRTGRTMGFHQYGQNACPFNDKADALAKQAVASHPRQLRPCVRPKRRAWLQGHNVSCRNGQRNGLGPMHPGDGRERDK